MGTKLLFITAGLLAIVAAKDLREVATTRDFTDRNVCGYQTIKRIVGGSDTKAGEYPWLAAIEYNQTSTGKNAGIKCGGSVVTKRYVLTAAHCLDPPDHVLIKVWLGVWKISTAGTTDKDKVKKFNVDTKIPHPLYVYPTSGNDIALLKLDADFTYTDYIRPVCLPAQDLAVPASGTRLTVIGWGLTEHNRDSDTKLKVDVPVVDNSVCANASGLTMYDSQMCAGTEKLKDSCVGDSGGPLMESILDPKTGRTHWYPHGLVSFGTSQVCGTQGEPAIYTRVSKFYNWVVANTS